MEHVISLRAPQPRRTYVDSVGAFAAGLSFVISAEENKLGLGDKWDVNPGQPDRQADIALFSDASLIPYNKVRLHVLGGGGCSTMVVI